VLLLVQENFFFRCCWTEEEPVEGVDPVCLLFSSATLEEEVDPVPPGAPDPFWFQT